MPRTRLRITEYPSSGITAQRWNNGSLLTTEQMTPAQALLYPYEKHLCVDEVNKKDKDNPLTINFEGRQFVPLNGRLDQGVGSFRLFENHIPSSMKIALQHATGISSLIPSVGSVATTVIARSNPSRPNVSIPNFLYELKDLPGMIRDIGNLKRQLQNVRRRGVLQHVNAKNAANHLLSYQMGWRPLLSDLRKLLTFQAQVDKKIRELENLYNNGGLQRRVRSPEWQASKQEVRFASLAMESSIVSTVFGDVIVDSRIERWGTVRWQPASRPDVRYSSKQMASLARRLVFGVNAITAKQVWDAIPWTWLVGWFSNVDDFIQAHSNAIPLTHSKPCIMTKTESKTTWIRRDSANWATGGFGAAGHSTKERTVSSGTLSATIPFLNGRQISILGALAIQRKR